MNIFLILQMAADAMPDRVAVVSGDERLTYAALLERARTVAGALKQDQKLGFLGESNAMAPVALFAAALTGAPYVPLNYRLAEEPLNALLKRTAPALIITDRTDVAQDGLVVSASSSLLGGKPIDSDAPDDATSPAIELFTSGTTGEPKSAILRHDNLMSYILGTVEFMSAEEDEATLISVPPYHIAGISAVLSSVYAGRRMVQLPNFSAEAWLGLAATEGVTNAFLVPTMLQRIVEQIEKSGAAPQLPKLRALAYGGGKMPLQVIEAAMDMFPDVAFTNAYGLTETSSTICLLDPDDHRQARSSENPEVRRRLGSVGRPLPTIEIQIRDEDGRACGADEAGLVFVRGDQVSGEYKGAGSQLDGDGWFPTKDRGFLDTEGFLFLDGRADDVIVRGGENISPGEIEDVVIAHPSVKDVAAVAVPDTEWGEAVGLAVVVDPETTPPGAEELCEIVRKSLRSSRVPTLVHFCDALPYNETGKLLRRVIRDDLARLGS
ncbi:MAG: class I adenylate-forming enzyme family protein [Pseudomonadota bacterium]